MKYQLKLTLTTLLLVLAHAAYAQSAGNWMVRGGYSTISPQVSSGNLSAPSPTGTKGDVGSASQVGGGVTYMYTDNVSVDLPVFLPFEHNLYGAGAIAGVGKIGKVSALPATVFLQYRFFEAQSAFRPYVGIGPTYAYFFDETGSGALTAITNPGGTPTKLKVDSQWTYTVQIGATYAFDKHWFGDIFYAQTPLKTTEKLSTGQSLNITLDPTTYGIAIGYKF
jgi:outer membrane protein